MSDITSILALAVTLLCSAVFLKLLATHRELELEQAGASEPRPAAPAVRSNDATRRGTDNQTTQTSPQPK
jgi:hypothetical protein